MKDDKVSILNRHISRRIDDILIIIFQIRIKIIIDISSFRVVLYSYSFKDTNSVKPSSPQYQSTSVISSNRGGLGVLSLSSGFTPALSLA